METIFMSEMPIQ